MWPPWLHPLLRAEFFSPCEFHGGLSRNECNMYCLDCSNGALCSSCLIDHRDHRVIQIRRSSYHDVIRVAEIQKHLDISGVQTYVINGARIVFLNERPQPRPGKTATNACSHCKRNLLDALSFCSLGCKLVKTTTTEIRDGELEKDEQSTVSHWQNFKRKAEFRYQGGRVSPPEPMLKRATKRRKGTPHRAPMGAC